MIPERTQLALRKRELSVTSGTMRAALINDSIDYTPDPLNHEFVSDVFDEDEHVASEFDDSNYSRQTISTFVNPWNDTPGSVHARDITWEELGGTQDIQAILIYKQIGGDDNSPEDDPIIRIIDNSTMPGLPMETNGADITLSWHPHGILQYIYDKTIE